MKDINLINRTSIISRPTACVYTQIDTGVVIMGIDQGLYCGLDENGSRIWELLAEDISFGNLIDVLSKEYNADRDVIERDVLVFLNKLLDDGFLLVK